MFLLLLTVVIPSVFQQPTTNKTPFILQTPVFPRAYCDSNAKYDNETARDNDYDADSNNDNHDDDVCLLLNDNLDDDHDNDNHDNDNHDDVKLLYTL